MKHPALTAEDRSVLGKKVKKLRREGLLPANVYGKGLPSKALQVKLQDFEAVFKEAGETGLVDLTWDGQTKPVLIKNLQWNHQTRTPLHTDFFQVNLKEKIKAMVPLVITDEAQAVTDKVGLLLQTAHEVEVEALPDKLPENIEFSVAHMAAVNDSVTVADLKAPADVAILSEPSQTVAKITDFPVEEPEETPEETAEGEAPAAEGESAEGESSEAPAEEQKSEETAEE